MWLWGAWVASTFLIIGVQAGSRCAIPYLIVTPTQLVRCLETGVLLERFIDVKINSLGIFHKGKPGQVLHECIKKGLALFEFFERLLGFGDIEHDAHQCRPLRFRHR